MHNYKRALHLATHLNLVAHKGLYSQTLGDLNEPKGQSETTKQYCELVELVEDNYEELAGMVKQAYRAFNY